MLRFCLGVQWLINGCGMQHAKEGKGSDKHVGERFYFLQALNSLWDGRKPGYYLDWFLMSLDETSGPPAPYSHSNKSHFLWH